MAMFVLLPISFTRSSVIVPHRQTNLTGRQIDELGDGRWLYRQIDGSTDGRTERKTVK